MNARQELLAAKIDGYESKIYLLRMFTEYLPLMIALLGVGAFALSLTLNIEFVIEIKSLFIKVFGAFQHYSIESTIFLLTTCVNCLLLVFNIVLLFILVANKKKLQAVAYWSAEREREIHPDRTSSQIAQHGAVRRGRNNV